MGTGNFGTGWGHGAEREEAKRIFDGYVEAGGNFLDTANTYQAGQSEELVGEFIAADRDDFVMATKYTLGTTAAEGISWTGNSRKAMVRSGKILYVGLSNFPAWRIARADLLAELRGWAPAAGIQIEYSLVQRTADRELLPMA